MPEAVRVKEPVWRPVPCSGTWSGDLGSLLTMLNVALREATALGVNEIASRQLLPGASVVLGHPVETAKSLVAIIVG